MQLPSPSAAACSACPSSWRPQQRRLQPQCSLSPFLSHGQCTLPLPQALLAARTQPRHPRLCWGLSFLSTKSSGHLWLQGLGAAISHTSCCLPVALLSHACIPVFLLTPALPPRPRLSAALSLLYLRLPLTAEILGSDDGDAAQHDSCPHDVRRSHLLVEHIVLQHQGHHHL